MTIGDIIFYIFIFLALYVQVFFLVTFLEKRSFLKKDKFSDVKLSEYPQVTFIVPCFNEEATVVQTIQSIKNLIYPQELISIFVVDDGSRDNTLEVLQKYVNDGQVRVFSKENGGKHSALNYALEYVETPFICSFDADTHILPDALVNAFVYFQNNSKLDALGGAVLINKPTTIVQKAQSVEYQMFSYTKKILGVLGGVLVTPGAFSLFKTRSLREVGGYRKAYLLEDLELTYRLQKNGYCVDHAHDAFVYTKGPESLKDLFKQRLRWSFGYINNTFQYRSMILNKKYGNFGMFTLPMTIIAYPAIFQVFILFWYNTVSFLSRKYVEYQALGSTAFVPSFSSDFFFVDTKLTTILTLMLFATVFISIYLGKVVSRIENFSIISVFWFIVVYSVMVPVWTLTALYRTIARKKVSWR
jgi:cellulose synthase/poly-beta-1,6-N-acetylglucosamine synthase-like glycosyltransferase